MSLEGLGLAYYSNVYRLDVVDAYPSVNLAGQSACRMMKEDSRTPASYPANSKSWETGAIFYASMSIR